MVLGKFITLEGGEGGGKSSNCVRLADWLIAQGHDVVVLKNHGATPAAAEIRKLFLSGNNDIWSPRVEAFLLYAARSDMWTRLIKPALEAGKIVISDRFADSTYVYQGIVGGLPVADIDELHKAAVGDAQPDLTFIMDLPVEVGFSRITEALDRLESKGKEFHQGVREGFLSVARQSPQRCVVIDAARSPDEVFASLCMEVERRFLNKAA